ncbi:hypothetical protein [Dactylosporangium darangshiense]
MKAPLGLLLAVAVLTGCAAKTDQIAQPSPSAEKSGQIAPTGGVTNKATNEATISVPPKAPKTTKVEPPVDDFQQVKAEGKVRVTGTCTELVTDQLTWTLIGPAAANLRDGQRARVVGVPDPNRETGCPGSPLLVSLASPQ